MNIEILDKKKSIISVILSIFFKCSVFILVLSCTIPDAIKPKKVSKDRPINASDRSLQNIKEGRGISLGNVIGKSL